MKVSSPIGARFLRAWFLFVIAYVIAKHTVLYARDASLPFSVRFFAQHPNALFRGPTIRFFTVTPDYENFSIELQSRVNQRVLVALPLSKVRCDEAFKGKPLQPIRFARLVSRTAGPFVYEMVAEGSSPKSYRQQAVEILCTANSNADFTSDGGRHMWLTSETPLDEMTAVVAQMSTINDFDSEIRSCVRRYGRAAERQKDVERALEIINRERTAWYTRNVQAGSTSIRRFFPVTKSVGAVGRRPACGSKAS